VSITQNTPVQPTSNLELEKYVLPVPTEKKNLNNRLGHPEFYPISKNAPEDLLNGKTISDGFWEPVYLEVNHCHLLNLLESIALIHFYFLG
jgi:hypothetical protein